MASRAGNFNFVDFRGGFLGKSGVSVDMVIFGAGAGPMSRGIFPAVKATILGAHYFEVIWVFASEAMGVVVDWGDGSETGLKILASLRLMPLRMRWGVCFSRLESWIRLE